MKAQRALSDGKLPPPFLDKLMYDTRQTDLLTADYAELLPPLLSSFGAGKVSPEVCVVDGRNSLGDKPRA